ncbi:MAG: rRNA maturation RNase YbeY [Rhodobacter sp.]|uniref:rRNA maturation RNase YbeY n=1 Tax=Pararhodobacter sp. TaxID=2127056 RepID=UPI001D6D7EF8|nr:rRNA maturation RNase YbeY [Pararhodobacter sp.]MCB1347018.1 rRNA maturation RNase YbeY [Paracoccaceae bacterium]MCC0074584.1 rRNA maturation RNase YbeY [Rhodobacter sp.]HPD92842.1 rRNA maturation RNase YbeY [Pararhodobacter sp.]
MTLSLDINPEDPRWGDLEPLARPALEVALRHLGHDPARFEVSVLACDDARIRALNAEFRGKDAPTNVLSWPAWDLSPETQGALPLPPEPGTPEDPEPLGDIALAWETCQREAADQAKTTTDHVTHLLVHSLLHLLGYDHETDEDAVLMEKTEIAVLAQLGIANPYEDDTGQPLGVARVD